MFESFGILLAAKQASLAKPPCLFSLNKPGLSESVSLSQRQFCFLKFCSCAKRVSLAKRNSFFVFELGLASLLAKPIMFQESSWAKRLLAISLCSVSH